MTTAANNKSKPIKWESGERHKNIKMTLETIEREREKWEKIC